MKLLKRALPCAPRCPFVLCIPALPTGFQQQLAARNHGPNEFYLGTISCSKECERTFLCMAQTTCIRLFWPARASSSGFLVGWQIRQNLFCVITAIAGKTVSGRVPAA